MGEDSRIEERKRYNMPFLAACKYLMQNMSINQGKLAKLLGTNGSHFSDWKSGKKRVSMDKMQSLLRISGGKINRFFLSGQSPYMLLENVPDEELIALQSKEVDQDYNLLERRKITEESEKDSATHVIDQSSLVNAAIAAKDELIASLKREAINKNELIESLKREATAKDVAIESLQQQIADLRARLFVRESRDAEYYPFPIGMAETQQGQN